MPCFRLLRSPADLRDARAVKERFLSTPLQSGASLAAALGPLTLPDGRTLVLPPEQQASLCEAFLQPSLIGLDSGFTPVHICALRALAKCLPAARAAIGRVALCGGHAHTPGLSDRLMREIGLPLHKSPAASLDPWLGSSILCSLGCWNKVYVSRREFGEAGAAALSLFSAAAPEG